MFRWTLSRTLALACVLATGVVSVVSGQTGQPQQLGSSMDDLVAELRGLRADLSQLAEASIRAQLLVARLQLQEQRLNTVGRQLADAHERLANTERALSPMAAQLKGAVAEHNQGPPETREAAETVKRTLEGQLEQMRKVQQELRGQEASLASLLAEEQARWSDFNGRLDELERMLPVRGRR